METKAITTLFTERGTVVCPAATVNAKLHMIESLFEACDMQLAGAEMGESGYESQKDAINTMTENMRQLSLYAATAHERVSEKLDQPLYEHFKKNAAETITAIKLSEITTENTFGLAEYVEIKRQGQYFRHKSVKATLTMEDFLGIQEVTAEDGRLILENVETVSEFASLFRRDYDTMMAKDISLDKYLEWYADSGDDFHKGYHPVADMMSGIADITIIKPVVECIIGKDLITGEYLTETDIAWKGAGVVIDLLTLGMGSKALSGAKTLKEVLEISGKTLTVDALSATASYGAAYIGEELGLSEQSIFILSMLAGGSVSYASGKKLLNSDVPTSFADMMSEEDGKRYLKFLENGSTAGLTREEIAALKKVDEAIALKKINIQDILDIRNADSIIEGGLDAVENITDAARKTQKSIIESVENSAEGSKGLTNLQKGNYGEMKMDDLFESQGYERISTDRVTDLNQATHQGIDGIYYNPDGHPPYIIGEAKYGSSKLSTLADGTPQMSDKWIIDRLEDAVGEEIANDIKMEMILNPDNVGSSLVHISTDGNINITELIDGVKQ